MEQVWEKWKDGATEMKNVLISSWRMSNYVGDYVGM